MGTNFIKCEFDLNLAKKITDGECEGSIVTRDGKSVRIICWDRKNKYNLVCLVYSNEVREAVFSFTENGRYDIEKETDFDLCLLLPMYLSFRDGDIIAFGEVHTYIGIFKEHSFTDDSHSDYVTLTDDGRLMYAHEEWNYFGARLATEQERQRLIDALKKDKNPKAQKYLKQNSLVGENDLSKFKPFDKVLVRQSQADYWECAFSTTIQVKSTNTGVKV